MAKDETGYRAEGEIVGAVGEGAAAHFHGLTFHDTLALARELAQMMRAAEPSRVHEQLARDGQGNVVVGGGAVVLSPLQVQALARAVHELPPDTPPEVRRRLSAVAQAVSDGLVPPADFACRAREYAARQQDQRGP